jgi:hypothetical protein
MKRLSHALVLMTLFAGAAQGADNDISLTCKLATKIGPFKKFTVTTKNLDEATLDLTFGRAAGFAGSDNPLVKCAKKEIEGADVRCLSDVKFDDTYMNYTVSIDVNDWASTVFQLAEDDEGYSAFVDFNSDGPILRSFYRCTKL